MARKWRVVVAGYSCEVIGGTVFRVGASEAGLFLGRNVELVSLGSVADASKVVGLLVRSDSPASRLRGTGLGVRILDLSGLSTGAQIKAIKKAVIEVVEGARGQVFCSC